MQGQPRIKGSEGLHTVMGEAENHIARKGKHIDRSNCGYFCKQATRKNLSDLFTAMYILSI